MRLFLFLAVAAIIVAIVCAFVPTVCLTVGVTGWIAVSLLFYYLDLLFGSVAVGAPVRRQ